MFVGDASELPVARSRCPRNVARACLLAASIMPSPHSLGVHKLLGPLRSTLGRLLDAPSSARIASKHVACVADVRALARQRAHRMVFDYIDGGSDDEISLRRNAQAFAELEMHYGVLSGHGPADFRTRLFGSDTALPFFVAPTAGQKMFHRDGEVAAATVCAEEGGYYCLSSMATTGLAEVSSLLPEQPKLLQLYLWKDRELLRDVLQGARESGFTALALTCDTPWLGNRERDVHNGFTIPADFSPRQVYHALLAPAWSFDFLAHPPYSFALLSPDGAPAEALAKTFNDKISKDYSWKDAEWLLGEWNGHTSLKGICRPDDAVKALSLGFDSVWVSNHGGRQLETSPPTIELLPAIREAVGPDAEILVDSGIMRGTDIAKAIALGANGVGIGKAYLYGLAAGGTPGVRKVFAILKRELEIAMGLLGVASVEELRARGPELVRGRRT